MGLYDPGANASMIERSSLKKIKNYQYVPYSSSFTTTSGVGRILGITILDVTIYTIRQRVLLYVIDSPSVKHDFIIGLDLIPVFKLSLDCDLKIIQNVSSDKNFTANNVSSNNCTTKKSEIWNDYVTEEMFNSKTAHLDTSKIDVIRKIVTSNREAFADNKFDVGNVTNYECPINLKNDVIVARKPYRCTFADQDEIERQCKVLLDKGMITQSSSPFASPVTMQFKKDGLSNNKSKTRMCVDYRELNKILVPESQPFPLIDEIIVKTRGCSWFSALDINLAFHSIPIRKADRYKSAFVTQHGHYEWCSMPFGLKSAPSVFQRILSNILRTRNLSNFSVNYLDDIIVFSRSFDEHVKHVQQIIDAIFDAGFRLNFQKCNFAMHEIRYLGHVISGDSVRPLQDNLVAINSFPVPSSRKNVRQFLGKINFYRKFIQNSSFLLEPFHNLLRKNVPFSWSTECQASFERVKLLLTSAPILAIFDRTKPVLIYTDASGVGIGAVLKQIQADGSEKPVAYFSRKLTDSQQKKKAIYIESLAIREAVRYWRYWLLGRHFTIITDHKPLQYLNLKARTDEELGDLAHELLQFDFEILYRPGSENFEADCLSRNPVLPPESDSSSSENPIFPSFNFLSLNEIKNLQSNVNKLDTDFLRSNIIYRKVKGKDRIVLDSDAGKKLTLTVHNTFGHIGSKHMILVITPYFTFPNMYSFIRNFSRSCIVCVQNKSRRSVRSAELGFLGPATRPYEIMSLDTIGGFKSPSTSMKYLHLLVDHFSRFAYILCTKGQTASEMISLIDSVNKSNQIGTLLTDQYGGLTSDEFVSYCRVSKINHITTAVDSPSSNGLNERLNQTLTNRIRCSINDPSSPKKAWTSIARNCIDQYNDTIHSVTKFTPSYLLNGNFKSILPRSLVIPPDLENDRIIAFQNSLRYHEYNKKLYDSSKRAIDFSVGDSVFVDNGNRLNRNKLDVLRIGPFKINCKLCNNVYEIITGTGPKRYHASKLLLNTCTS